MKGVLNLNFDGIEMYVRQAKEGVEEGFNMLYELTVNQAYFEALLLCSDKELVAESIQLTYIDAFKNIDQLKEEAKFWSWLRKKVRGHTIDLLRKKKELIFSDLSNEEDYQFELEDERIEYQPDVKFSQDESKKLLKEIIDSLSNEQRVCITMFYFDEMKINEIAYELGVSESTIKSRLKYGKDKIKQEVLAKEKEGIKLYGIAPIPLLLYLVNDVAEQFAVEEAVSSTISNTVLRSVSSASTKASTASALAPVVKTTAFKVVTSIVAVSSLVFGTFSIVSNNKANNESVELIHDTYTFEYGEQINLTPEEVLNTSKTKITEGATIQLNIPNEDNKDFAAVGSYPASINFKTGSKNRNLEFEVAIKDSTPPTIEGDDDIRVKSSDALQDKIRAIDLSKTEIKFDDSSINYSVPGTYSLIVTARDEYANESQKEIKVTVPKPTTLDYSAEEINKLTLAFLLGYQPGDKINSTKLSTNDEFTNHRTTNMMVFFRDEGVNGEYQFNACYSLSCGGGMYTFTVTPDGNVKEYWQTYSLDGKDHTIENKGNIFDDRYKDAINDVELNK